MLLEPEPHMPDTPAVSSMPDEVDIPELCVVPDVADIPEVAGIEDDMSIDPAAVAGVEPAIAMPPPS